MMESAVMEYLAAGGNALVAALAYGLWRLDRRLLVMENKLDNVLDKVDGD